jgi:hypothetical protein
MLVRRRPLAEKTKSPKEGSPTMKFRTSVALALSSLFAASALVAAAQATPPAPPKVLVIQREYLKPGKAGAIHAASEANFVRAATDAKSPTHYIAMDSLSGPTRALYLFPYDSFGAWGKDQEATAANPTLSAAIDQASLTDGELLTRYDSHVYSYHPEMSLHATVDISHARYWQLQSFKVKAGHDKDWSDLVKIYTDGFASMPAANWAAYESQFDENNGGLWVVITPMKTLDEVDSAMGDGAKFWTALSPANQKRVQDLAAACIESSQKNVFVVNPKESYVDPDWVKAAPEIWAQH